ncbi:MAG: hypothetical protein JNK42_06080 [Caedimonas sp.]|nr:hypothetical protein [Caedimonas sp.]
MKYLCDKFQLGDLENQPEKSTGNDERNPKQDISSDRIEKNRKDIHTHISKKDLVIWEWRSFWPENCPMIPLLLAPFKILSFDEFKNVNFDDAYLVIKENLLNLKTRDQKLVYKPLVEEYGKMLAFGHKKKVDFPLTWHELYPLFPRLPYYKQPLVSPHELALALCESDYQVEVISVQKNAYRYKMSQGPQLELSRIKFHNQVWYSICLEGLSEIQVRKYAHSIVTQEGKLMGYAEFLNQFLINDQFIDKF